MPADPSLTHTLGKVRVYSCVCGASCVRTLDGGVMRCERCNHSLKGRPFLIEDFAIAVREMVAKARGAKT